MDVIFGGKMDSPVIHITTESKNPPFFVAEQNLLPGITYKEKKDRKRRIELTEGGTNCQLYNDFVSGIELSYDEKFTIATNLININGGRKRFLDISRQVYGEESFSRWEKRLKYMSGYHPKRCSEESCPYYNKCIHENTMIDTLAMDRKVYQGKTEYVSIDAAESKLKTDLESAFQSCGNEIHLIKAQTGLGKTTAYIDLVRENPQNRFLVALPTNILKEEVGRKLRSSGIPADDIFITPSVYGNCFFPDEIQKEISEDHMRGIHNNTKKHVKDYYEILKKEAPFELARLEDCEKLLKNACDIEERILVTTHAYFLQLKEEILKKFTVIIDEDFLMLQGFNRMYSVSISCLEELAEKEFGVYSKTAGRLLKAEEGRYQAMDMGIAEPLTEKQLEELEYFGMEDNINDLKDARTFVRMKDRETGAEIIKYFCPPVLPRMKYIVLSATFNQKIYRAVF